MFNSEFEYKVDDKGRLPIPPKFRSFLKDGVVLIPGADNCITAYTPQEWKKFSENIAGNPLARSKMRRLGRMLFAQSFTIRLDPQGRIALPPTLREHAQITDDVVVTGVNTHLEIWDKALWTEEKTAAKEQFWQILESLENNS